MPRCILWCKQTQYPSLSDVYWDTDFIIAGLLGNTPTNEITERYLMSRNFAARFTMTMMLVVVVVTADTPVKVQI